MITKRIIPCLDVKDGRVVKGVNFLGLADVSDPVKLGQYYSDNGAGQTGKMIDCPVSGTLARQGIAHETGIPGNPQARGILERLWQVTFIPLARTYPTCTWRGADENATTKMLKLLNRKDQGGVRIPSFRQLLDDVERVVAEYNLHHTHRELGGTVLLPIHWATFDLAFHGWSEPIEWLMREAGEVTVAAPRPGERFGVDGPTFDQRIKLLFGDAMRTYTIREVRPGPRLVVDFVLHLEPGASGPAAAWAATAAPGDTVGIIAPRAGEVFGGIEWAPGGASRLLLAGDETAVPAISAILEQLPPDARGAAYLEVPCAQDLLPLHAPRGVDVRWLARDGRPHGSLLAPAVRGCSLLRGYPPIRVSPHLLGRACPNKCGHPPTSGRRSSPRADASSPPSGRFLPLSPATRRRRRTPSARRGARTG